MKIQIENKSSNFCEFWDRAEGLEIDKKKELWEKTYGEECKEIFNHFAGILKGNHENPNLDEELEYSLRTYPVVYDNIKELNCGLDHKINEICEKCSEKFNINDIQLKFIPMVGLFIANAFVTPFEGGTAFYFLEKMGSPKTIGVILAHEITHLFQFSQISRETYMPTLGERIFSEGLACFMSKEIYSGFDMCEYVYIEEKEWKSWFEQWIEKEESIKDDILINIRSTDRKIAAEYLNTQFEKNAEIPERVGYLVGYLAVEYLAQEHSLEEMVRWDTERVLQEMKSALENIRNMNYIEGIKLEEDRFPKVFTNYEERDFGVLFFNMNNKTSYDSNHAVIYRDKIENLGEVLDSIIEFYKQKDIAPSVYQALEDEEYFMENEEIFKSHGFNVWSEGPAKFMMLIGDNVIDVESNMKIEILDKWDERIADDICIPSDETHEIEVIKAYIRDEDSKVFVGYIEDKAVAITYFHVGDYNCCRFDYIIISKEYRGRGLGRELLSFVTDYCRDNNIKNCYQWPAHETSERICYEAGFREVFSAEIGRAGYVE